MKKLLSASRVLVLFATAAGMAGCIVVPVGDLLREPALEEYVLREGAGFFSKDKIAVIDVGGIITASESRGVFSSQMNTVAEVKSKLDRASMDGQVKAVVLRISSPGGEVTACDMIHHEIQRFRDATGVPIVASIQEQGASGAYYIAVAADTIVAHPTAVVGSIGVVLHNFDLSGLMGKIGVVVAPVKSGDKKDLNSPFRPMAPEERAVLQALVDEMHARFVSVVDAGREGLDRKAVEELADGRVFSGVESARLGLVDRTGYLQDAVDAAAREARIDSPTIVSYSRRRRSGANIYTGLPSAGDDATEIRLRIPAPGSSSAALMYLWQPGL